MVSISPSFTNCTTKGTYNLKESSGKKRGKKTKRDRIANDQISEELDTKLLCGPGHISLHIEPIRPMEWPSH
jgi:hypothetical protein